MAHHSSQFPLDPEGAKAMKKMFEDAGATLGATGKFPEGKLGPHDEGEIRFAIAADPSSCSVLIDFGKSIRSLGMTPEQARGLAADLIEKAEELD